MSNRRIPTSKVAITKNSNESKAIAEALDLLEIKAAINTQDVIVITANWVSAKPPSTADVVGDITLKGIIEYFKAFEPKKIVVAAGSGGGDTLDVMKKVGYDKIIKETGAHFVDLNEGPFIDIKLRHKAPSSTMLNNLIHEMTFHISFTQLKMHEEATMSASIKNMALSWPPTAQHGTPKKDTGIHKELHCFIAEMAHHIPIDLSILSASPAMIATGPHNGIAVHSEMVICGTDPVSTDVIGARLLGFKPQAVQYLYTLGKNKVGAMEAEQITFMGIPLKEAEENFCQSAYKTNGFIVDK
ncbi:MAG: DUF362 domain-containing protein [Defluviitaleaceae bacterium]|nr:DUF362 domain-containing protein [Defluviitaleaceae bacterium]